MEPKTFKEWAIERSKENRNYEHEETSVRYIFKKATETPTEECIIDAIEATIYKKTLEAVEVRIAYIFEDNLLLEVEKSGSRRARWKSVYVEDLLGIDVNDSKETELQNAAKKDLDKRLKKAKEKYNAFLETEKDKNMTEEMLSNTRTELAAEAYVEANKAFWECPMGEIKTFENISEEEQELFHLLLKHLSSPSLFQHLKKDRWEKIGEEERKEIFKAVCGVYDADDKNGKDGADAIESTYEWKRDFASRYKELANLGRIKEKFLHPERFRLVDCLVHLYASIDSIGDCLTENDYKHILDAIKELEYKNGKDGAGAVESTYEWKRDFASRYKELANLGRTEEKLLHPKQLRLVDCLARLYASIDSVGDCLTENDYKHILDAIKEAEYKNGKDGADDIKKTDEWNRDFASRYKELADLERIKEKLLKPKRFRLMDCLAHLYASVESVGDCLAENDYKHISDEMKELEYLLTELECIYAEDLCFALRKEMEDLLEGYNEPENEIVIEDDFRSILEKAEMTNEEGIIAMQNLLMDASEQQRLRDMKNALNAWDTLTKEERRQLGLSINEKYGNAAPALKSVGIARCWESSEYSDIFVLNPRIFLLKERLKKIYSSVAHMEFEVSSDNLEKQREYLEKRALALYKYIKPIEDRENKKAEDMAEEMEKIADVREQKKIQQELRKVFDPRLRND